MHRNTTVPELLKGISAFMLAGLISLVFVTTLMAEEGDDPFDDTATSSAFSDSDTVTEESDGFADSEEGSVEKSKSINWTGFLEIEQGSHIGKNSVVDKQWIMSNRRFRLATSSASDLGSIYLKVDLIEDGYTNESRVDIREARVVITPAAQVDLSIGKQVNTWGVADMLFINDLFPKNWVSNFLGRDMESMKDAANSVRMTGYMGNMILDVVVHPEFAPDTTPTGCRLSVYDPNSQSLAANADSCGAGHVSFNQPEDETSETAVRLKTQLGSYELAAYAYYGFYKNPKGLQWADADGAGTGITDIARPVAGHTGLIPYYPRLQAQGISLEGQLGPGMITFEAGRYHSMEDEKGDNPLIENSKMKTLLGYRMDFSANIGGGIQWYQEQMQQYDEYEQAVATTAYDYRKKERHNTYTLRLTLKAQQETLWINFFRYQRPEDFDSFTKLDVTKRLNDNLEVVTGMNLFEGKEHYEDREFGMLKDDDNLFARVKYNF